VLELRDGTPGIGDSAGTEAFVADKAVSAGELLVPCAGGESADAGKQDDQGGMLERRGQRGRRDDGPFRPEGGEPPRRVGGENLERAGSRAERLRRATAAGSVWASASQRRGAYTPPPTIVIPSGESPMF